MKATFKDYFSNHAEEYSQYRPGYPVELFIYLASITPNQQTAWDCATGNGQSALMLSDYFKQVIATDASETQIKNANQKKGISYHVAPAEDSSIDAHSIDLITVAQAYHWFDYAAFTKEVKRVLKADGVVAIWTYNLLTINSKIDHIINEIYDVTLGDYWAFERKMVEGGYKDVSLPFNEISPPAFQMSTQWNFAQLIGYLCTWSAVKKYQQKHSINPVEAIHDELLKAWGDADELKPVTWPLSVKVWQNLSPKER